MDVCGNVYSGFTWVLEFEGDFYILLHNFSHLILNVFILK